MVHMRLKRSQKGREPGKRLAPSKRVQKRLGHDHGGTILRAAEVFNLAFIPSKSTVDCPSVVLKTFFS
eukprot:786281-Heterocapsa_arctica.AAC.1